jgi:hypothetical protein
MLQRVTTPDAVKFADITKRRHVPDDVGLYRRIGIKADLIAAGELSRQTMRPTTNMKNAPPRFQSGAVTQAAPFQMPRAFKVAVTSTIQAVRLAAIVMLDDTETTELA